MVPAGRVVPAVLSALAVTLAACAALPLRAALAHRAVRLAAPREDLASARPSRRRTVAELTLLVLAAGAVATLRRRGTTGDELTAVAPVLVGLSLIHISASTRCCCAACPAPPGGSAARSATSPWPARAAPRPPRCSRSSPCSPR